MARTHSDIKTAELSLNHLGVQLMVTAHTQKRIIRLLMFWFSMEFSDYGATIVHRCILKLYY